MSQDLFLKSESYKAFDQNEESKLTGASYTYNKKFSLTEVCHFDPEDQSWFKMVSCHMLNVNSNAGTNPFIKEN